MKKIFWVLIAVVCLAIVSWLTVFWLGGCASTQQEIITTTTIASTTTITSTTTTTTTTTMAGAWINLGPADGISEGNAYWLSLKVFKGIPYIAYNDASHEGKATVLKYNASLDSWATLGPAGFSDSWVGFTYLYVYDDGSADGVPFIGINNGLDNSTLAVLKYNKSSNTWENLGKSSLTTEVNAYNAPLYVYDDGTADGQPYVAFSSGFTTGYAIRTAARKYNKTTYNWDLLGTPEFPTNNPADHSVALSVSGDETPYLAYVDYAHTKVTVMKYTSGAWEAVGPTEFSISTSSVQLAFSAGVPYVSCPGMVYQYDSGSNSWVTAASFDTSHGGDYFIDYSPLTGPVAYNTFFEGTTAEPVGKASVMKYQDSAWQYVGAPRFSDGQVFSNMALYVDNGVPYVAYADYTHGSRVVVKKFE